MSRNDPLDPYIASQIRQVVRICGIQKVRRLLDEIERESKAIAERAKRASARK